MNKTGSTQYFRVKYRIASPWRVTFDRVEARSPVEALELLRERLREKRIYNYTVDRVEPW